MQLNQDTEKKKKNRILKLIIKIAVTTFCFWYISTKINFTEVWNTLLKANWIFLGIAIFIYAFSKFFSAFRLNIYFRNISLTISEWNNIKLYWVGMFYNLFLPGAIGGDAYKVIILNKRFNSSIKKTSSAVLLDRFSGLLALGVILAGYAVFIINDSLLDAAFIGGAIFAVIGFYLILRWLFKDFIAGFWPTFIWGLAVQICLVVCIYFIMFSLRIPLHHEWILIFLLAAIVSVFPISLGGGLGTRELVFAEGAVFFHIDPHLGIIISLLFHVVTIIASLPGLYYLFNDPLKIKKLL